jgi:hypothetical protein
MGAEVMYKCDQPGCGKIRLESNHWFAIAVGCGGVICAVSFDSWKRDRTDEAGWLLACGEACLGRLFAGLVKQVSVKP